MSKSRKPPKKVVSDALGCFPQQLEAMRNDAKHSGFSGVEFVADKTSTETDGTPNFYQATFSSESERQRYIRHRGLYDKNGSFSGATLGQEGMEAAQRLVERKYGKCPQRP